MSVKTDERTRVCSHLDVKVEYLVVDTLTLTMLWTSK